jgi:Domain of unknown function (DUF4357)
MTGRTVRLYMADGSPLGIRQCEIFNRTIHALAISRGRLPELRDWEEAKRSGVYFLFGKTEEGNPMVYIGEAQRVVDRVSNHVREKDFWNEAVLFVNKDENMHAKYLEARLIDEADKAGRYQLENGKFQELPILSRADRAAMEEIIPDIRLILGVLGHLLFEPLDTQTTTIAAVGSSEPAGSLVGREFVFGTSSFEAKGRVTDEGFLIIKGSKAAPKFTVGNAGYDRLRQKLLQDGTLKAEGEHLIFTKDYSANSASQAASVVAGGNRSGPESWKSDGKSLGEIEAASVAAPESGG